MSDFAIERFPFDMNIIDTAGETEPKLVNWPIVYTLDDDRRIYVGESLSAVSRMHQHHEHPEKQGMKRVRIVVDETFNKSVCLDLESYLIRYFAGDGRYELVNGNTGVTDADYYGREQYQARFDEIFEQLRAEGLFSRTIPEIENSDLFKLSPYKALTRDQAVAIEQILEGLSADQRAGVGSEIVVQGDPGTGKTVVAIYLTKLLRDIARADPDEQPEDSMFADFFLGEHRAALADLHIGMVIPQQSLRASIHDVFRRVTGLHDVDVLSPFDAGKAADPYDLLIVDEAHRLGQRASQPSAMLNREFTEINQTLFGDDDPRHTQLDWIRARSRHRILLLDTAQSVRPSDLPTATLQQVIDQAEQTGRRYPLFSQLRVQGGRDYIDYVRRVLSDDPPEPRYFSGYDLRLFDDPAQLVRVIRQRDADIGLCRLVAGYGWPWRSRRDPSAWDIDLGDVRLRWNSTLTDWINTPGSVEEVGSIHTVQGYDLNIAGVIIGPELGWDAERRRLRFSRADYHDRKGKENNRRLGITYTDDDLLHYVENIYRVLLTRGMKGTYVYVADPELREHLRRYFEM